MLEFNRINCTEAIFTAIANQAGSNYGCKKAIVQPFLIFSKVMGKQLLGALVQHMVLKNPFSSNFESLERFGRFVS
ncbi:MAG: hypothetical protein EA411_04610 [Saprospirales bacterium]|nr:MAG: hypothetical protein EA411_04610 [Saprospirales bacterium]